MNQKKEESKHEPEPMSRWIYVSFGVVGLAVGFFSGISSSPVASALLPILFATLGGASGLFLAQGAKSQGFERALMLAKPTMAFICACMLAAIVGISIRTGAPLSSFIPTFMATTAAGRDARFQNSANLDERLRYLGYRQRVAALRLPDAEKDQLLADFRLPAPPSIKIGAWQAAVAVTLVAAEKPPPTKDAEAVKSMRALADELRALASDAAVYGASASPAQQKDFVRSSTNVITSYLNEPWIKTSAMSDIRRLLVTVVVIGESMTGDSAQVEPAQLLDTLLQKQSPPPVVVEPSRSIASEPTKEPWQPGRGTVIKG